MVEARVLIGVHAQIRRHLGPVRRNHEEVVADRELFPEAAVFHFAYDDLGAVLDVLEQQLVDLARLDEFDERVVFRPAERLPIAWILLVELLQLIVALDVERLVDDAAHFGEVAIAYHGLLALVVAGHLAPVLRRRPHEEVNEVVQVLDLVLLQQVRRAQIQHVPHLDGRVLHRGSRENPHVVPTRLLVDPPALL